jgi:radical SAM-linked protein
MIVRMRFTKSGKIRWTSHRDVARIWERALRRAGLPVAYTQGFSPRPELSFGLALPTGCESVAEYLDVSLTTELDPRDVAERVGGQLPTGIEVVRAAEPEPGSGSLQEEVTSCAWEISVPGTTRSRLAGVLVAAMSAGSLPVRRERKGRLVSDDVRPSLIALRAVDRVPEGESRSRTIVVDGADEAHYGDHGAVLTAELATRPRGVRPMELAQVLGIEFGLARRTCQWIERGGSKFEPLEVEAAVATSAPERVS